MDNGIATITPNDDLLKSVQITAMNVSGLSEQMGLVVSKVNEHNTRIIALEDRMTAHEMTETITSSQRRQMYDAVHARVDAVLGIVRDEFGHAVDESLHDYKTYYQIFIRRLYSDAKKRSSMALSYSDTLKVNYEEVMTYITTWLPVEGVDGLKEYADRLAEG